MLVISLNFSEYRQESWIPAAANIRGLRVKFKPLWLLPPYRVENNPVAADLLAGSIV
jgi:hypothetical protein